MEGLPIHLTDTQRDDLEEMAAETKLDVSRPTIAKSRRRFLEHGVEDLTNRHRGRPPWS